MFTERAFDRAAPTSTDTPSGEPAAASRLRAVLRVNAVTSAGCAAAAVVGGAPVGRLLGVPGAAVVAVGAALAGFVVVLVLVSRAPVDRLAPFAAAIGWADAAWVAATAVLIGVGAFEPTGAVVVAGVAVVVGVFAVLELRGARSLGGQRVVA